ncbi:MAG: endonuclease III [Bacilli bacterium]|nr:endonuclease III [Bacilli bacterium]
MITKNKENFMAYLDELYPNAQCELNYNKDYELLIAVVLSAQCTDKRVNLVTKELFSKYTLKEISQLDLKVLENIIRPVGTMTRKAVYVKNIAISLLENYNGTVPNNREYLESLSGVGHKTANVVLSNLYGEPCFAVDTHVSRVSKRLGFAKVTDDVIKIEKKLMKTFPKDKWSKMHHQMVLFGRYECTSRNPKCENCKLSDQCLFNRLNKQEKF